ncbi:MAG TPA: prepilin peptidase [bacterium]|nr:prepilin peptidase [bacterium]
MAATLPLFPLWACLLGLLVGSFLNVCIHRLPKGQSVVIPRSYCPDCGRFIRWYDNVPLFSYLALGGRCRACKRPISLRYPLVESLTAALSLGVALKFGPTWAYVFYFLLLAAPLVAVTFIDLGHKIIPDIITLPGIAAGVGATLVLSGLPPVAALSQSVLGLLAGGGTLFAISWLYEKLRRQEGIGGGDVKLAAMLGAFFGWKAVFVILFLASLLGSVVGIALVAARPKKSQPAIPFGPFLSAAALIYLFVGKQLIHWYLTVTGKLY